MNILTLASIQLQRENKPENNSLLIDRAKKIRKWLDIHKLSTAKKIMQGNMFYQYGNTIKTYQPAI
jgi:hypothetical protein